MLYSLCSFEDQEGSLAKGGGKITELISQCSIILDYNDGLLNSQCSIILDYNDGLFTILHKGGAF